MKNVKPYPKYKPSNIPWLGDVPEHWEVRKSKRLFDERSEKGFENEPFLAATQSKGVILKSMLASKTVLVTKDFHTLKLVEKGDFVISLRSFQGGIEYAHYRGIISPAYTILKPRKGLDAGYFSFYLKSKEFISALKLLVTGIREGQNIDTKKFRELMLPFPPLTEQTAIANFLDYKTKQIDRFVRKKKQIIKLLNEQKTGIINQAVTRGINPDAPTKPSGIDWLGDIPQHWKVRKLKYVANCFPSNVDKHTRDDETEVRLCNYTDVYKNDFIVNNMNFMVASASDEQISKFVLLKNDVVITKDSETANDIAVPVYVREDLDNVVCGYHLSIIRPYKKLLGYYLFRVLQCKVINIQFEVCANGVTRVGLGTYDTKKAKILIPPLSEQQAIVEHIEREIGEIDKIIKTIEKEIDLVQEFRTTLIAEAVTGKIDVRNYEIPTTDEAVEDEPDEEEIDETASEETENTED